MSEHAIVQPQKANVPQEATIHAGALEHRAVNQPEPTTLPGRLFDAVSSTFMEPRFAHDFSRVRLRAEQPMVQRLPRNERPASAPAIAGPTVWEAPTPEPTAEPAGPTTETTSTPAPAEPTTEPATPGETPAPGLLVEDSVDELAPGQMKKSDFLAQLRTTVSRTAEAALAGTGLTTEDCPYLDYWFDYYSRQDSSHIERAIHRYTPETSRATTASGYVPIITQRVRRAVETWSRTGEITGVPEGIPTSLPGEVPTESGEGAVTATGPVMLKKREGGVRATDDPQAIQAQLGEGHSLDGGVRSRMESAFGMNFAHVRTHTDSAAAGLSSRFNAYAFTVGEHVAFGAGEYQPGTLIGDALIAHELAHVVQQGGRSSSVAPMKTVDQSYNVLEKDADKAAVGAVVSLWCDTKGALADIAQDAMPCLRSGLRLQRCAATRTARRTPESVAEEISGDTLCPQFISMTAQVREPTVSAHRGRCRMGLGYCPTPRGTCGSSETSGATIAATVETAEGCTGELSFLQNLLNSDRRRTLSDESNECMTFTTPHRDGIIPWKGCTLSVTSTGRHTITTDDCPNIKLRETLRDRPGVHMTTASANESFKMFLRWRPTEESARVAIANVTWGWNGSTTRQEGTDCASRWTEPSGITTDGDGIASRDRPVTSPTVREDYEWRECAEE